jgi:hypothetical protein
VEDLPLGSPEPDEQCLAIRAPFAGFIRTLQVDPEGRPVLGAPPPDAGA